MRNIRLIIEYDGTQFYGFQRLSNKRSVQGELEKHLSRFLNDDIKITGAGRTDAGVHASGQMVNFKTKNPIPLDEAVRIFNAALPEDLSIRKVDEVSLDFNARRMAKSRTYRYTILNRKVRSAKLGRFTGWVPQELSAEAMNQAAKSLLGEHDFAAFQAAGSPAKTTFRRMKKLTCRRIGELVCIVIEADGFLYQMARIISAAMIEIGKGNQPPEWLAELLSAKDRKLCPAPAPPQGLCLVRVTY